MLTYSIQFDGAENPKTTEKWWSKKTHYER